MIRRSHMQVEAAVRHRYGAGVAGLVRRLLAGEPIPWATGIRPALVKLAFRLVPRRIVVGAAAAACLVLAGAGLALLVLVFQVA